MDSHLSVGKIWDEKWKDFNVAEFVKRGMEIDLWITFHKQIIEKYAERVDSRGLFLEAGCGMGYWCFYVSEKYKIKSVGVDIAPKTIAKLNDHCRKEKHTLASFLVDDLNNSNLPKNKFDMFVSLGVIEHFEDSGCMMRNLYNLLKPGGIGIITVPNLYSFHTITRPFLQLLGKWNIGYEKSFSPKKLKNLSLSNSFKIVEYGILPSGDMFGCFLNSIPVIGKIFKKISLFIEKRQNIFSFISFVVV